MASGCLPAAKTTKNPCGVEICCYLALNNPSAFEYDNFQTGAYLFHFPKMRVAPVKFISYTQAAAASQPKPLRVITGSSAVRSKMVETSYVGSSPVSMMISTKLSKRSNSSI